ncbi:hypothetical protein [Chryseobacterium sp.]|uniref:hypothetical protein n=1 Tax=Chryseobacterium sp. TaxID=1871047 RepID=UPI002FCB9215
MKIPVIVKRIGNYFFAFLLSAGSFFAGISAIKTSNKELDEVAVFNGKVLEKGITEKSSSVSGKGSITSNIFYIKLQGLDQTLGVYNPRQEYKILNENIEIGNTLRVYFKYSFNLQEININTFQIEKNNKILLKKDDYQSREGIAGYLMIVGGFVLIGIAIYQDKRYYW